MNEYRKADADGRINLTYKEYDALRTVFGAFNALTMYSDRLERRCKSFKNGWRDMRLLCVLAEKIMNNLLQTIPTKKLLQIREELKHSYCIIKVEGAAGITNNPCMYIRQETLIDICKAAVDINCFGCDKTQQQAKRECKLYGEIQECFGYEFDKTEDCPFADGIEINKGC